MNIQLAGGTAPKAWSAHGICGELQHQESSSRARLIYTTARVVLVLAAVTEHTLLVLLVDPEDLLEVDLGRARRRLARRGRILGPTRASDHAGAVSQIM